MSAQPSERDDDLTDLTRPRFTLSWRENGQEVTVDLDDVPDEALPERVRRWQPAQAAAAVEDIRWMADHGESIEGVARRLSAVRGRRVTRDAVERFLHRQGARVLLHRLTGVYDAPAPLSMSDGRRRSRSPQEAETRRRRWSKGPGATAPGATSTDPTAGAAVPRGPLARIAQGGTVRGAKPS